MTVENIKQCKHATDELINLVKNKIHEKDWDGFYSRNYLEDGEFEFELHGVTYDVVEVECSSWDDQGKYQYQDRTYQLASFNPEITSVSFNSEVAFWASEASVIDKFNLFITLCVQRSGSYFTDYDYSYGIPTISIAEIETIPEKIIPQHDVVKYARID